MLAMVAMVSSQDWSFSRIVPSNPIVPWNVARMTTIHITLDLTSVGDPIPGLFLPKCCQIREETVLTWLPRRQGEHPESRGFCWGWCEWFFPGRFQSGQEERLRHPAKTQYPCFREPRSRNLWTCNWLIIVSEWKASTFLCRLFYSYLTVSFSV